MGHPPGQDDFGMPDRVGFEFLLLEPFVEYSDMVFRKPFFDKEEIDRSIGRKTPERIQRERNHTHLFLYVADIAIQRQWAEELERNWRKRIATEFPKFEARTAWDDNGQEVILTFWVVTRSAAA